MAKDLQLVLALRSGDGERAEAEHQKKEEPQKVAKDEPASPTPAAATPPLAASPQPAEAEPPADHGATCVGIWVSSATGEAAPAGLRVLVIEEPDTAAAAMYNGRTNGKGRLRRCGLTAGHRVRVVVFGPRGAMLGSKMQVLSAGLNVIPIQLDRDPVAMPQAGAGDAGPFQRRRPRWQRP